MSERTENELHVELLAAGGMNPWHQHDSSPRMQMVGGHLSQALVVEGATTRRCLTGIERELGRFTFSVKMPVNAEIIRVVEKYPRMLSRGAIKENPLTVVVYEDAETKEVGILNIPRHHCVHQHFGFRYNFKPAASRLVVGGAIAAGTILADSPTVDEQGNYRLGLECETAFMSLPGIIEDGFIISKDLSKRLTTRGFESRVASWGNKYYPLNLYGNEMEYKPFPDIGDRIRDDGLLFALRTHDELLAPVEMTAAALREPDYTYDRLVYAEPGALVIDVSTLHERKATPPPTPIGMDTQTLRYHNAQHAFYKTLLDTYGELKRRRREALRITPEFHRLLVEAQIYCQEPGKNKAKQIYQRQPLDDWRVEVTFEYAIEATVGFKMTGLHGDKGVVCSVWETEDMPVDAHGNRADIIMDGDSTIKRMNIGRMYEQYINATSRHISKLVREWMSRPQTDVEAAWNYVINYYRIVSPKMYDLITGPTYARSPKEHLDEIVKDGIYLYMPTDNPASSPDIIEQLRREYPIPIGPVSFVGRSGQPVTTKDNVLIGSLYCILLEKTGGDWSAVSSSKLQHFGIPARPTRQDKNSLPGKASPVRVAGETEVRLMAAVVGGEAVADLLEMSNAPGVHKQIVANVLRAEQPSNIQEVAPPEALSAGQSRSQVFVHHALQCAGVEFYRQDSSETIPVVYPPDPLSGDSDEPIAEDDDFEEDVDG